MLIADRVGVKKDRLDGPEQGGHYDMLSGFAGDITQEHAAVPEISVFNRDSTTLNNGESNFKVQKLSLLGITNSVGISCSRGWKDWFHNFPCCLPVLLSLWVSVILNYPVNFLSNAIKGDLSSYIFRRFLYANCHMDKYQDRVGGSFCFFVIKGIKILPIRNGIQTAANKMTRNWCLGKFWCFA